MAGRSIFLSVLVLGVGQLCLGTKVVVLPFPNGFSHFYAMAKIGAELEIRGHEVVYVLCSMDPSLDKVKVKNKLIYDVRGYPVDYLINSTVLKIVRTGEELTFSEVTMFYDILYEACDSLLSNKDIVSALTGTDIVFSDNKFAACGPLLQEFLHIPRRVDFASWSLNELTLTEPYGVQWPLSYIPLWRFVTSSTKMTFLQRLMNVLGYVACKVFIYVIVDSRNDRLKNKYGIRPGISAKQLIGEAEFVLLPVHFALEWVRPLPPGVKVIGPPSQAPANKLPRMLEEFMQSSGTAGVVLVSFGSLVDHLEKERTHILLEVFSKLEFKFIWKSKKRYPNTSTNIMTLDWIPQNDILGHPKTRLFLTHAGPNGMYESAFHGVPMLAMPQFGDQHVCAQQIKAAGIGLVIDFRRKSNELSAERVVKLIQELTTNSKYKENAIAISKILQDYRRTPAQEGADWIEFTLRHPSTARRHLHSVVNDYWLNYLMKYSLIGTMTFVLSWYFGMKKRSPIEKK